MPRGTALVEEMNATRTNTPTLWWLGHAGFAIKFATITFYIDPRLSTPYAPLQPQQATNADMILCTHEHAGHMDPATLSAMLEASPKAKVVLPKSKADFAHQSMNIPYERMTTTDNGLRIEYFKDSLYGRVYSVPAAHPELEWHPIGGFPRLGYLIRFERITIYHAGDTLCYEGLADRLKPYNPTVAILPIGGTNNMTIPQGAELARQIGARWLIPMHYEDPNGFIEHMLGHRPAQKFKVFAEPGEQWTIPQLDDTE